MTWVWEHSRAAGTDLLVLLAIADHAADDGGNAYPSVSTLARKTRVSERTVQRSIRTLVELGELAVDNQGAPIRRSDRRSNLYIVLMDNGVSACHPVGERGDSGDAYGVTSVQGFRADGVSPVSPKPSFDPSVNHPRLIPPRVGLDRARHVLRKAKADQDGEGAA